jgi:glycine dehydrogenase
MQAVIVNCDARGDVDLADLAAKTARYRDTLAAVMVMVTYPSTHCVFEEEIRELCDIVHGAGGQVYVDGANLNVQVGLARPGDYGADVSRLNLHNTVCIPHGGGGPGIGLIGFARQRSRSAARFGNSGTRGASLPHPGIRTAPPTAHRARSCKGMLEPPTLARWAAF